MLTDVRPVSNGRKWHIDHINNAPTADEALRRMDEWIRAELRDCQLRRPQDADGFRWQIVHRLAGIAWRSTTPPPGMSSGGTPRGCPVAAGSEARRQRRHP